MVVGLDTCIHLHSTVRHCNRQCHRFITKIYLKVTNCSDTPDSQECKWTGEWRPLPTWKLSFTEIFVLATVQSVKIVVLRQQWTSIKKETVLQWVTKPPSRIHDSLLVDDASVVVAHPFLALAALSLTNGGFVIRNLAKQTGSCVDSILLLTVLWLM